MAAATGVNIGAISDPQHRVCFTASVPATAQNTQQQNDQTPPTFLVTQSLVSLLTEKGIYCYSADRTDHEASGESAKLYSVFEIVISLFIVLCFSV